MAAPLAPQRLSDLIGAIYDCAVQPERWPETMHEICTEIHCLYSAIILLDLEGSRHRFLRTWNTPNDWMSRHDRYHQDVTLIYKRATTRLQLADEPIALSRDLPEEVRRYTRYQREWARPQGVIDTMFTVVLREPRRAGIFSAVRHESVGYATDEDIAVLRLLAPHIRRAVTISDVMDLKTLEANAMAAVLDSFALGVVLVAEDNRILHANKAAQQMFAADAPVRSVGGRLSVRNAAAGAELARAVALARGNEAAIGAVGIGVALNHPASEPAVAHVLPLARGGLRTRLMPQATAAIFVTQAATPRPIDVSPIAKSFRLTPRETRLLENLVAGMSLGEAAAALAIAETTAKTHLGNIFSKTGVARQADLIALVHRLAPPLRGSTSSRSRTNSKRN